MSELLECRDCGRRTYYEKRRCPVCGGTSFDGVPAGTGELLSVTTVHVTPDGVREPNALGLASFPGGANVVAQLDEELSLGDEVRLVGDRELRVAGGEPVRGVRIAAAE
ncbi:MAG: Zn-ribbon domain-containing OB-fold protein [Halorubrum sp.]